MAMNESDFLDRLWDLSQRLAEAMTTLEFITSKNEELSVSLKELTKRIDNTQDAEETLENRFATLQNSLALLSETLTNLNTTHHKYKRGLFIFMVLLSCMAFLTGIAGLDKTIELIKAFIGII